MSTQLKVLLFNFSEGALLPVEVREYFNGHREIQFDAFNTPLEASTCLAEHEPVVFIFIARDEQDFSQAKLILKRIKNITDSGLVKSVAILKEYNRDTLAVLKRLGCNSVFSFKVSADHLIQIIEEVRDQMILSDTELASIGGFDEEDNEDSYTFSTGDDEAVITETRISSVTEVHKQDDLLYQAVKHPKLGGISLEPGSMQLKVNHEMPPDSKLFLEHFGENELEFEVKTEDTIDLKIDQTIELEVKFLYDRCKVEIIVDGVVQDIQHANTESSIISINLSQDESLKLEQFMQLCKKRQTQISEFMEVGKEGILYNPIKNKIS